MQKTINTLEKAIELPPQKKINGSKRLKVDKKDFSDKSIGKKMHTIYKKMLKK